MLKYKMYLFAPKAKKAKKRKVSGRRVRLPSEQDKD